MNGNAGLSSINATVCRIQLLLSVDRYRYSGVRISIGGDMQTDISYSPILQCHEYLPTDIRHQSNTNCPFVIVLKMHCGYLMCVLKLEILILDCCRYSIDSGYCHRWHGVCVYVGHNWEPCKKCHSGAVLKRETAEPWWRVRIT